SARDRPGRPQSGQRSVRAVSATVAATTKTGPAPILQESRNLGLQSTPSRFVAAAPGSREEPSLAVAPGRIVVGRRERTRVCRHRPNRPPARWELALIPSSPAVAGKNSTFD